jgi:acyl-coenzyme A synthetase/AMP-(fatty) acid ligase
MLGLVPSLARAWRASNCMAGLDWSSLRCLSSTGEASTAEDSLWLSARGGHAAPVVEYIGGTEIGGGFLAGGPLQAQVPATFSTPTVGAAPVLLLSDGRREEVVPVAWSTGDGEDCASGATAPPAAGELALRPPLLGASQRLLNADHAAIYYAGMPAPHLRLRRHGDELARLAGGRLRAQGRADDAMNLGGVKVAAAELERAVAARVRGAAEAAAVAARPPGGGPDRLVLFVVERAGGGAPRGEALRPACQAAVSAALNPLFRVEAAVAVAALPRTASNKVMRRVLRARAVEMLYGGGGEGGGGTADGGAAGEGSEALRAGDKARRRSKL